MTKFNDIKYYELRGSYLITCLTILNGKLYFSNKKNIKIDDFINEGNKVVRKDLPKNFKELSDKVLEIVTKVTYKDLIDYSKSKGICPRPDYWNELYNLLDLIDGNRPETPLILGGWWHTSSEQKLLRFQEHIEWASKTNQLDEVGKFLVSLKDEDWFTN